jgi:glycine hydroxymethyltransferase
LIVTRDATIAERLDHIAFPGMTANFDAAKSAALAISLLDWRAHGRAYAQAMVDLSQALARELAGLGLPVFATTQGMTQSHQFAIEAAAFGGGQAASKTLRQAGFLACGIGLPRPEVAGDLNGLRIGTPELVRRGVTPADAPALAALIAEGLRGNDPGAVAARVKAMRARFTGVHYIRS